MPGAKQQIIDMIQRLPEEASLDDILEEIYFRLKVDDGLRELDEGRGIEHADVEARLARWASR